MQARGVTEAHVERCLATYHTTYPAEPATFDPKASRVYVAQIDDRTLKVYVEVGSDPPLVKTVAWRDAP